MSRRIELASLRVCHDLHACTNWRLSDSRIILVQPKLAANTSPSLMVMASATSGDGDESLLWVPAKTEAKLSLMMIPTEEEGCPGTQLASTFTLRVSRGGGNP